MNSNMAPPPGFWHELISELREDHKRFLDGLEKVGAMLTVLHDRMLSVELDLKNIKEQDQKSMERTRWIIGLIVSGMIALTVTIVAFSLPHVHWK